MMEARVRELVRTGDFRGAATEALRWLDPQIRRYLRASLRDEADANDAFSQFSESLWKYLPSFRGESSLRTWAFALAVHAGRRVRDEAWKRRVRRLRTGEASAVPEVRTNSKVKAERQRRGLLKLRAALDHEDQMLLALRVDQQLPWADIAAILTSAGTPVTMATLCKRFERLTRRLRRMAHEEGIVDTTSSSSAGAHRGKSA